MPKAWLGWCLSGGKHEDCPGVIVSQGQRIECKCECGHSGKQMDLTEL